jgi:hypothetical protein
MCFECTPNNINSVAEKGTEQTCDAKLVLLGNSGAKQKKKKKRKFDFFS